MNHDINRIVIANNIHLLLCCIRIRLAAIHYNANADRDLGKKRKLQIHYPKFKKGEAAVKALSSTANYGELIIILLELHCMFCKLTKNVDEFTRVDKI